MNRQKSTRFRATRTVEIWNHGTLAERNVAGGPVVEHPEAPSGINRPTRTKVPSKTLNEEEVNAERAVHAKHQRAGHLGELQKRRNVVRNLITGPGVQLNEVEDAVERYEDAFHNFVSCHENCLRYEVDEEMRALMIDSYDNQRDLKITIRCPGEWLES